MSPAGAGARHRAREAALQMLYQWEVGRGSVEEVLRSYSETQEATLPDRQRDFAHALVRGTAAQLPDIDPIISAHAQHWRLDRMAVIDRLILRLGVFELCQAGATPPRVVIDEAVELAKTFSSDEAAKFVNGILDAVWKERQQEP